VEPAVELDALQREEDVGAIGHHLYAGEGLKDALYASCAAIGAAAAELDAREGAAGGELDAAGPEVIALDLLVE
jgi:hypothetical protein